MNGVIQGLRPWREKAKEPLEMTNSSSQTVFMIKKHILVLGFPRRTQMGGTASAQPSTFPGPRHPACHPPLTSHPALLIPSSGPMPLCFTHGNEPSSARLSVKPLKLLPRVLVTEYWINSTHNDKSLKESLEFPSPGPSLQGRVLLGGWYQWLQIA